VIGPNVQSKLASSLSARLACNAVVLRWCGLRVYNTIGQFSSLTCASECVRTLNESGFTSGSISTVALFGDNGIEALVGVHSDDARDVDRASAMMRAAKARVCCF
jgi:hypothetical protein